WNAPLASVVASYFAFVAVLVRVTLTPGIYAPEASFTTPAILPTGDASTEPADKRHSSIARMHVDLRFPMSYFQPRYWILSARSQHFLATRLLASKRRVALTIHQFRVTYNGVVAR